jgi:predicted RNase H-like HicB family nuclease
VSINQLAVTALAEKMSALMTAYSPDLPGCVSTGRTREEVEANTQEAIAFHIEGLKLGGYRVPEASSSSAYVEVAA